MSKHQWLSNESITVDDDGDTHVTVTTSAMEMYAVLRGAAVLARDEGMVGTADRLQADADRMRLLSAVAATVTVEVKS